MGETTNIQVMTVRQAMLPTPPTIIVVDVTVDSAASIVNKDASGDVVS